MMVLKGMSPAQCKPSAADLRAEEIGELLELPAIDMRLPEEEIVKEFYKQMTG